MTERKQPETSMEFVERIREILDKYADLIERAGPRISDPDDVTPEYCGRLMAELRQLGDDAEEKITEPLKALYRHYQQNVMVKRIHELGGEVEKFSIKGVGTFRLSDDFHISIKGDKKEEAKLWLVENNAADLITETVNASSLKAWSKKFLEREGQFPDETIFKSYAFEYVKLTAR